MVKGIAKLVKVDILTFKINSYYAQGFPAIVPEKRHWVGKSDCGILKENTYSQKVENAPSVKTASPLWPVLVKSIASKNSNLE